MMNRLKFNSKGFTLIELLVVVSIIGLLSSVVLASVNSARAKARDARRLSDVHQITNAIYLAMDASGGNFPSSGGVPVCLGTAGTCWVEPGASKSGNATLNTLLQPYLPQIPKDPAVVSGKGDRYLYGDSSVYVSPQCNGSPDVYGPFIIWVPDIKLPYSNAECKNASFTACCGSVDCVPYDRFCVYQLR